jgi:hypothetical protein
MGKADDQQESFFVEQKTANNHKSKYIGRSGKNKNMSLKGPGTFCWKK